MMTYPTELVEKAKYEMKVFERVSADTGTELIAEVKRLRAEFANARKAERERCAAIVRGMWGVDGEATASEFADAVLALEDEE